MTRNMYTLLTGYGTWIEMSSTAALFIKDGLKILFDTGADGQRQNLLRALDQLNLLPEDIDVVANTHLHMDHCGNNLLFSRSRWYCSDTAYEDLINLVVALNGSHVDLNRLVARYLAISGGIPKCLYEMVVRFLKVDAIPEKMLSGPRIDSGVLNRLGIDVIDTPGHTDGHVSFVCHDDVQALNVIVAGDAIVSQDHMQPGRRTLFTKDVPLAERSKRKLAASGGWYLPGHGRAFFIPKATGKPTRKIRNPCHLRCIPGFRDQRQTRGTS